MTDHPTRRRLLAISAGLLGAALAPVRPIAQGSKPKLPDCQASATFGDWVALAYDSYGVASPAFGSVRKLSDIIVDADFDYNYYNASSSYELNFRMRRAPAVATFDVALSASGGANDKATLKPKEMDKGSGGEHVVKVDVSSWFREPNNPLKRVASVTITVSNGGAQLFAIELKSNGFAEATEFMRAQQARLEQLEKSKQCQGIDDCFLTTACCELIGLDDDCFELRSLRAFRDGPLGAMPGGKDDIARYYRQAPLILAEMSRRGDSRRLLRLYATHILPSAMAARLGLNRLARGLYTDMMRRLERRYMGLRQG